jgi:hypothetical protein
MKVKDMSDDWELALLVLPFGVIMVAFAGLLVSIFYYPGADLSILLYILYGAMVFFIIGYAYSRYRLAATLRAEHSKKIDKISREMARMKKHEEE